MKTLIAMLLISIGVSAQEVFIFDVNGKLISPDPIEKLLVPDMYDYLPDGKYYLETKDPVFIDPITGKKYYERKGFIKELNKIEFI